MKKTKGRTHDGGRGDGVQEPVYVYGRHVLIEALRHRPDVVEEVFLRRDNTDEELLLAIRRADVKIAYLDDGRLPLGVDSAAVHQGVVARIAIDALVVPYKTFVESLSVEGDTALLLLGEVQDPHNVGAVIRSAAAFGLAGVLIPPHNQAPITGAVIKVSAGMAFRIPLVSVSNLNTAVRDLKERGFWIYGLEGEGGQPLPQESFDKPSAFILGNEATGLRQKTKEACDILISIPIHPRCESLNAAAATASVLYAWSAQHPSAVTKLDA